jgi:hypothetical protein
MGLNRIGTVLLTLFVCLAGCASIPDSARELPTAGAQIELSDTPFHAQERYQCGPAALTTVLEASGAEVTLNEIVKKVYLPDRQGSLQLELLAATRTSGRLPYVINSSMDAILSELDAGRPVLVLQNLGVSAIPRWHYAVVVGIDTHRDRVILRSGTERRRETPINLFLRTWSRSEFWGFVALQPGELPAIVDRDRYFETVVGMEQAGRPADAADAWQAALHRWPDNTTALFGLGNSQLALGDTESAERSYEKLIAASPGLVVARNNLAMALAQEHRFDAALEEIDRALSLNDDESIEPILEGTRTEILSMAK